MKSMNGYKGPRQLLDAKFTFEIGGVKSLVLKSKIVRNSVYYAAVERLISDNSDHEVFALICLIHYDRHDHDGYIFGYKDMDESMQPYEYDCPESILKLLTQTESANALAWRAKCRERNAARKDNQIRRRA